MLGSRKWTVTVRHRAKVDRDKFEEPAAAVRAVEDGVRLVLGAGRLGTVKALRDFEPGQRVAGRIEISGPGGPLGFGAPSAGVDVMGDGAVIPYVGSVQKRELDVGDLRDLGPALLKALGA